MMANDKNDNHSKKCFQSERIYLDELSKIAKGRCENYDKKICKEWDNILTLENTSSYLFRIFQARILGTSVPR